MCPARVINFIHKVPALFSFRQMSRDHSAILEPFQFISLQGRVAYEGSKKWTKI